jgi:hypothetical protein
MRNSMLDSL